MLVLLFLCIVPSSDRNFDSPHSLYFNLARRVDIGKNPFLTEALMKGDTSNN